MDWIIVLATLSPILLALLGGFGWLYRHERERREEVERQLSEHKYQAYIQLVNIFFDMLKNIKKNKKHNEQKLIDQMIDVNKELLIYGSDEVAKTYFKWLGQSRANIIDFELFGDIIVAIRRDMGNHKTKVTSHDVLRMMITDFDEALATGQLKQHQLSENT